MERNLVKPVIEKGGFAIYEKEHQIIFVNRQLGGIFTLGYILVLLTIILGINGVIFFASNVIVGLALILISILSVFFIYSLFKTYHKKKATDPNEQTIVAIIDVERKLLLDARGNQLAPMSQVKISRGFNITSSSPSIIAKWGKGQSKKLFKFNGLVGGSEHFIAYFKQKGYWN